MRSTTWLVAHRVEVAKTNTLAVNEGGHEAALFRSLSGLERFLLVQEPNHLDHLALSDRPQEEQVVFPTSTPLARPRACLVTTETTWSPASIRSS